jgi:hypothetical protein
MRDIRRIFGAVGGEAALVGYHTQYLCEAYRVRSGNAGRGAALKTTGMDIDLRGIIVHAARAVEKVVGGGKAALIARGRRTVRPADEKLVVKPRPGIIAKQGGLVVYPVEKLEIKINMRRDRRTVEKERVIGVVGSAQIGVEHIFGELRLRFEQAETDKTGVPGVKAVPALARRKMPYIFPVLVNRGKQYFRAGCFSEDACRTRTFCL